MDFNVTVYSTLTCPYCRMAKEYLNSRKIQFRDINVGADKDAAMEMVKKSGQMGVPVIEINGKVIVGFDRDAIDAALNQ